MTETLVWGAMVWAIGTLFLFAMDWIGELYKEEARETYRWYQTLVLVVSWPLWVPLWALWKFMQLNPRHNGEWNRHD